MSNAITERGRFSIPPQYLEKVTVALRSRAVDTPDGRHKAVADKLAAPDWSGKRDVMFRALAHPVKRTILQELVGRDELSASAFARGLDGEEISVREAARHMRELRNRGLLESSRDSATRGGIEHFYRLKDEFRCVGAVLAAVS